VENGEVTTEPLSASIAAADDPVTCAIYAREHNLFGKSEKKLLCMVNQAKLRSYNTTMPKYNYYGFEVPSRGFPHAMRLDMLNKNTRWQDTIGIEATQPD
jgi:hypothetical protein